MNIAQLGGIVSGICSETYTITIARNVFTDDNMQGLKKYNQIIKSQAKNLAGVYIWVNRTTEEVIYVGMAGKVKTNGQFADHTVQKRLVASRKKDAETKKDIGTNRFIFELMISDNMQFLDIHVFHMKVNQLPSYAEALLLNAYFQANGNLPKLNNAF